MIQGVISGGQIGADIAGLRAAKRAGIPTGGYAAEGYKTLRGPNLDLRDIYGLIDTGAGYAHRTEMNVRGSDGTIRFATNWDSAGERCTHKALLKHDKPFFDVTLRVLFRPDAQGPGWVGVEDDQMKPAFARMWLLKHNIQTLNVAGNGRTDIELFVENYLAHIF